MPPDDDDDDDDIGLAVFTKTMSIQLTENAFASGAVRALLRGLCQLV